MTMRDRAIQPTAVRVDDSRCQGHALCQRIAPEVFDCDDYGRAVVRPGADVPAHADTVSDAAESCPEQAIEALYK